jgi:3-methylcrotonyl-CoA carboxylase alpha subunit
LFSLASHCNETASLWECIGYWRINNEMKVRMDGLEYRLELVHRLGNHFHFQYDGKDYKASLIRMEKGKTEMILNGNHFIAFASMDKKCITQVTYEGFSFTCERNDILVEQEIFSLAGYSSPAGDQRIVSPMPGKVVKVNVTAGSTVKKGDILLVVEAMKMENNITAPKEGLIESVNVKQGEMVDPSTELVKFAEEQ